MSGYTELQRDALGEIANVGSGLAGTSLSLLLGRPVDLSIPRVEALPLADAVDAVGDPARPAAAALLPLLGDVAGHVVLLFPAEAADVLCRLLGVDPRDAVGRSALGEVGNVLASAYLRAVGTLSGLDLRPATPQLAVDALGAIVSSVLSDVAAAAAVTLVLDTRLRVEDEACALTFLLVADGDGVRSLLLRLGLPT